MNEKPLRKTIRKAGRSAVEISLFVIPCSIGAAMLNHSGCLERMSWTFAPLTKAVGLPTEAAVALTGAAVGNLYIGISLISPIDMTCKQMTVFGCFAMLFHSVPLEAAIARRIGIPMWRGVVARLLFAILAASFVNTLPAEWFYISHDDVAVVDVTNVDRSFTEIVRDATAASMKLAALLVLIVVVSSVSVQLLISQMPSSAVLDHPATLPLLGGLLLGITYGAGFILTELERLRKNRMTYRCTAAFLLLAHGIFEETAIFVVEGAVLVPLLVLRLIAGFVGMLFSGVIMPCTEVAPITEDKS